MSTLTEAGTSTGLTLAGLRKQFKLGRRRVDALDGRRLLGTVRTVAPVPQLTAAGDEQYPVVIEPQGSPADLRAGMTVRVEFAE